VDVNDVSVAQDCSVLNITVVSKFFEGMVQFKRRDMVNKSLSSLRGPHCAPFSVANLHLLSQSEAAAASTETGTAAEQDENS
jgi:acid stress-induced BolA-like protein IbaG/YrbA